MAIEQGFKSKDVLSNTAFGRRMTDKFGKKHKDVGLFIKGWR